MALDEPKDSDEVFEVDGFTYLVDVRFLTMAQPITVDFNTYAFCITGKGFGAYSQCGC